MKKNISVAVIVIIAVVVMILPTVFSMLIDAAFGLDVENRGVKYQERTYEKISYTELTDDQRREDFDYYFEMLRTSMPTLYEMRDKFGYSVLDSYDRYVSALEKCGDDYRFLAFMSCLANDIPSGHSAVTIPSYYDYFSSGYYRTDTVGLFYAENMRGKLDAYRAYLTEKQKAYDKKIGSAISFSYVDGTYLCTGAKDPYYHSTLVSANGVDPDEYALEMLSPVGQVCYDTYNEKPYRNMLMFSDSGSDAVTLTLKLADGTLTDVEYYADYDICYAMYNGFYFTDAFEEYFSGDDREEFETAPDADDEAITVYEIKEYDLAYVQLDSLYYSDGSAIKDRLREISGYKNIAIDLRGNGGGLSTFFDNYIYPALYKDDAEFEAVGYMPKTKYTEGMFPGLFDGALLKFFNDISFKTAKTFPEEMYDCADGKYYRYKFTHELYGDSSLSYPEDRNVYYIVNNYTCSAADEVAQMVKSCDLGKIVGTNTLGEGLILGVLCDWMPNSLLMYTYCPMYCVDSDGVNNTLYGTQPDLRGGTDLEGYILSDDMAIEGLDWRLPKYREQWDRNYRIIISDIESKTLAAS